MQNVFLHPKTYSDLWIIISSSFIVSFCNSFVNRMSRERERDNAKRGEIENFNERRNEGMV